MSKQTFELVSAERLNQSILINWKLCFICQKDGKDNLQSPFNKRGSGF